MTFTVRLARISCTKDWYVGDPLWDGEMCGGTEGPCCNHTGLPWFIRQSTKPTVFEANIKVHQPLYRSRHA